MGYRGFIRAVVADIHRAERESRRRQRELERRQKEYAKMQELTRAKFEVDRYENQIEVILSVHKECGNAWDWQKIKNSRPPQKPTFKNMKERIAQMELEDFKPGFFTRLLGLTEKKLAELEKAVNAARIDDDTDYKNALKQYEEDYKEWEETHALAEKICAGDTTAYSEVVKEIDPFSEIHQLGSTVKFSFLTASLIEIELKPNSETVIPSEIKTLLKNGKLSIKKMPESKFNELYQDYVCSCLIRVSREIFALLPIEMVIIHAIGKILNSKTGHMEDCTIVSAAVPGRTIKSLNFMKIDPSDSIDNFVHNMKFNKHKGFEQVEKIYPSQFEKVSRELVKLNNLNNRR